MLFVLYGLRLSAFHWHVVFNLIVPIIGRTPALVEHNHGNYPSVDVLPNSRVPGRSICTKTGVPGRSICTKTGVPGRSIRAKTGQFASSPSHLCVLCVLCG